VPLSRPSGGLPGSPLPLRPLTFGELLDAAVALLREHARIYLTVAVALAGAEQALLYPVRLAAGVRPPWGLPTAGLVGPYWVLLCLGFGLETAIICFLGGLSARAAGPALLGERLRGRDLLTVQGGRFAPLTFLAALAGGLGFVAALAGFLPWLFVYGLLGLTAPALVIDRVGPGRALLRSLSLAGWSGMRAGWIRLGGYLAWSAVRVALTLGALAAVSAALAFAPEWSLTLGATLVVAGVNAVAYATLGCLDAVLHLETRMRAEGLDITLGRAMRTGTPSASGLAVHR
jgi:hypothetical protein